MAAEVGAIQEQVSSISEEFREVRHALRTDQDFTYIDAGAILAEQCAIAAVHVGGEARKRAAELGEEVVWRGVEAFRSSLGFYALARSSRNPQWEDSNGFLATAIVFNATQDLLDKHGRNGDI